MLLTTVLRAWRLPALLALGACGGDFTLVGPLPEGPLLSVHVAAVSDGGESTRYDLNALFRRGRDAQGEPTQLADRALYVDGTPVLPGAETTPGTWPYRWQLTRATTSGGADSIRVTLPLIANSSPVTHGVAIPVARRDGPADVDVTRGDDVLLRVSSADGTPPRMIGGVEFWTLEIRQGCSGGDSGPQISVVGRGPYPSELRVPWQWLETLPAGPTSACFRAFSSFEVIGAAYPAFVNVAAQLAWRIHVVEPAP